MIDQQVIIDCPVVKSTLGQIVLLPDAIATIGGLLQTQKGQEWAAFGWGTIEDGGLTVRVSRLTFPAQDRSAGEVVIAEHDQNSKLVCVIHSHHSMGAWFSQTDIRELNPLYRASIVVAELQSDRKVSNVHFPSEAATPSFEAYCHNLGFAYQAVMRTKLSCGSVGEIAALVGVDDPGSTLEDIFKIRSGWSNVGPALPTSKPCPRTREVDSPSKLVEVRQAECDEGLRWESPRVAVWGADAGRTPELMRAIKEGSGRRRDSSRSESSILSTRPTYPREHLKDDWEMYQQADRNHRSETLSYPRTAAERDRIEKKLINKLITDLSDRDVSVEDAVRNMLHDPDIGQVMVWLGLRFLRTRTRDSFPIDSMLKQIEDWDVFELIAEGGLYV